MPFGKGLGHAGRLASTLEIAANSATIVVALLLTVIIVRSHILPGSASTLRNVQRVAPIDQVRVGSEMNKRIPGVNWRANRRTVVLVLSTRCHFCTESAPFFRSLKEKARNNVKFVAVLPQPVAESERYLSGEGLHFDEIQQAPVGKIGVKGTPTMLLIDRDGIVRRTWAGKVSNDKQQEALDAIIDSRF